MPPNDGQPRRIKAVVNASEILKILKEEKGYTVSELSSEIGLSRGTVHTYLATLKEAGFVEQVGTTYRLSYRFIIFGEHVRNESLLYQAGKKEIKKVVEETQEYGHLMVEHAGAEVSLYEFPGKDAIATEYRTQMQGELDFLHCGASGKAILAHLSEERVLKIIDHRGLPRMSPNTITDREALFKELAVIRDRGYALNDEEEVRGVRAVSAPVLWNDEVIGAISISAPKSRLKKETFYNEYPDLLMNAANVIEVNIETMASSMSRYY